MHLYTSFEKVLLSACVVFGSVALTGQAVASTVLTSTQGNVSVNGESAAQSDAVGVGDTIEVEGNGIASVLVGDTAVVRMCHGAALGFGSDAGDGPSALNLRGGQVKVSAGKRPTDHPLEIHTPAAIATLLGTEVHVDVDEDSGATTITSIEHQIRIAGSNGSEPKVISPGEKITISADGVVGEIERADAADLAFSSDCLDDARFRIAAVKAAVRQYADKSMTEIAQMDIEVDVPQVAAGPAIIPAGTLGPPTSVPACLGAAQCSGMTLVTDPTLILSIPDDIPAGPGGPP